MAGTPFSLELFNAREEVLSSDVNRAQRLGSRELQDFIALAGADDESRRTADPQEGIPLPVSFATTPPDFVSRSAFTMTIGQGQAFLFDNSVGPVNGPQDDSPYRVVRWFSQALSFVTPDVGNPRVDLVVATPASVSTDSATRFVIQDPVARTVAPATVNKSQNPVASLQVIAGTPDPQPVAPAVPAGAIALCEVYVPAGAANSTAFKVSRRIWRSGISVGATAHGILNGCLPTWIVGDESTTPSSLSIVSGAGKLNRAIINGELITFAGLSSIGATLPGVVADAGTNSPYDSAAPATQDKVYYLYLCGGRSMPQGRLSSGALQPACVVESLVPPTADGRPSAVITTPRGTTQEGALYIGCGYVVMNSTRRKPCYISGDWIYAMTGQLAPSGGRTLAGFNDVDDRAPSLSGSARSAHTLHTKPNLASAGLINALVVSDGSGQVIFTVGQAVGTSSTSGEQYIWVPQLPSQTVHQKFEWVAMPSSSGILQAGPVFGTASFFFLWARAWNMHVPRLSE